MRRRSGLAHVKFPRTPAPGRIVSAFGEVDILSADRSAGAASGFDLAIVDEIGLLSEADRELIAGMRSAVSAKDGRFLSLSVHGDGPFIPEIIKRKNKGAGGLCVHHYTAPPKCRLDDPDAWHAANPGLSVGIKSLAYMQDEAARVAVTTSDQASFRAYDLNQPQNPAYEKIVSLDQYLTCANKPVPERSGPAVLGIDLGGSGELVRGVGLVGIWKA